MPKIIYDRKNCEGYFVCVTMDPDSFEDGEEDGEDKADLVGSDVEEKEEGLLVKEIDEDDVDAAMQAASGCPADVIKVVDDDGEVLEGPEELPIEN